MNEGIHLDLDTWIVPGQIRKANLCRGLGNRYTTRLLLLLLLIEGLSLLHTFITSVYSRPLTTTAQVGWQTMNYTSPLHHQMCAVKQPYHWHNAAPVSLLLSWSVLQLYRRYPEPGTVMC